MSRLPYRVSFRTSGLRLVAAVVTALAIPVSVRAQDSTSSGSASRATLDSLAQDRERRADDVSLSSSAREAWREEARLLRERLRAGDFLPGDQIALNVPADSALTDTFTVRTGQLLALPNVGELSLAGVLRSELQPHLAAHLAKYFKNVTVTATPLIRIAVLGEVRTPGFYRVPAYVPISDALMAAGGPTGSADLAKATIRRTGREVQGSSDVARALSSGVTLDQLGVRPGDEIVVGARKEPRNWGNLVQIGALLAGILVSISALSR